MFHEDLAKLTADHLRSHIEDYLKAIDDRYNDKKVKLIVPRSIEPSSVVGGLMTEADKILPAYGIDILSIHESEDATALWTHAYDGQINGLVGASNRDAVDRLSKRHCAAVLMFIRDHLNLHTDIFTFDDFKIVGFGENSTEFSGAEDLGMVQDRQLWLAAFSINTSWFTSEEGPGNHGQ